MAYFENAKKSHPDLHPDDAQAELRFKEVSEAYEVLSDANARTQYDNLGHEGYYSAGQAAGGAGPGAGGTWAGQGGDEFHHAEQFHR